MFVETIFHLHSFMAETNKTALLKALMRCFTATDCNVSMAVKSNPSSLSLSSYSVAVTRSQDVPSFGPPIPKGITFPKSTVFRDFLLGKVINAENAAHKSDKFGAMATRTRQEYLRDLAERHVTSTPVEPTGKFPFISLAHKRREKVRPYSGAELRSLGAVTWQVHAEDQVAGAERECLLAISNDFIILLDQEAKAVVFNCATRDVIGWSTGSPASMKVYYERGESVSLRSINNNTEDFGEVVKRLEVSGAARLISKYHLLQLTEAARSQRTPSLTNSL